MVSLDLRALGSVCHFEPWKMFFCDDVLCLWILLRIVWAQWQNYLKYCKTDSIISVLIIVKLVICHDCQTEGHSLPSLLSLTAVEAVCRAYISWFVLPLILHAKMTFNVQLLSSATLVCLVAEKCFVPVWEVNSNTCILINVQTLPGDRSTLGNLDLNQGLLTTT